MQRWQRLSASLTRCVGASLLGSLTAHALFFEQTGCKVLGWADFKDAVRTLGTPFTEEQFKSVRVITSHFFPLFVVVRLPSHPGCGSTQGG